LPSLPTRIGNIAPAYAGIKPCRISETGSVRPSFYSHVPDSMTRPPSRIDKYDVVRRLGSGGMGTVYLARDTGLGREVAIKVLRGPVFDTDDELLARFLQEARATARLRHTNIVTVYEVGQHDHQPFIVMEFVPGDSLATIIQQRRVLPLATKLHYLEQICAGLHFAHRAGIVHRDIKPANLMVDTEGMVRILDFGIARLEDSRMTRDGDMMGTVNYMSPEQMLGRRVDHRSDLFAVGTVAYELLSYRQAFPGTMQDGLLQRLPNDPPLALSSLCPDLDPELEALVNRSLEKTPEARQRDLAHVQEAISACRRRLLQQRGAAFEVSPAPPPEGFAATLHRPRPRTDPDEIRSELEDAERSLKAGDPTSAVKLAERIIQKAPSSVEAHALLLRAQRALALGPVPISRRSKWAKPAAAAGLVTAAVTAAGFLAMFDGGEVPRPPAPPRPNVGRPMQKQVDAGLETPVPSPDVPLDPQLARERLRVNTTTANSRELSATPPAVATVSPRLEDATLQPAREPERDRPAEANGTVEKPLPPATAAVPTLPSEVPAPPPPAVNVLDRERPGIIAALDGYRSAYRTRSVAAMEDVFPTLPRERRQAYEKAFKDRRACPALDVQFGAAEIFLGSSALQANVTVMATYVCKPATAQESPQAPQADVFQMRKSGDRWQITAMGELQR
jgi:serine/threonine protein kinase